MLQPKKPNPAQKSKRITPKAQYESEIDWDKVRSVNDNVAVQAAKMFDPTGITSYPDVYYAAKDLSEGKGSWGELGLNVLGALPMIGKTKTIFRLAKSAKASKTIKNTKKAIEVVEDVASKLNKITNPANIKPLIKAKSILSSSKQIGKADVKNVAVDLLDIGNVAADATTVIDAGVKAVKEPSIVNKDKKIKYYNTDPKRGEVEKPGQLADVQYVPVSNSAELKMWKDQKLAYGTNQNGIMKKSMNPRKKYLNGSNSGGVTSNGIPTPASTLNDYNIMMAQAEQEAASNEWLPVVGMLGGLAQSAISFGAQGGFNKTPAVPGAKAANGMNNVNADVEVEGGEMYETPQGDTGEFQGPSHEQGGIPLEVGQDVQEGTKVYSDRLKVGKETLAERKAKREKQIANLEKIAIQPLVDTAVKNATKRKMEAIQREEMADLQYQEQVNNMQQMADTVVAAFGTSMEGLQENTMEYGMGTGADGVMKYEDGTDEDGIMGPMNKPKAPMYMKQLLPTPTPNFLNNFDVNYVPSDFNIEGLMEGETPFVPATGVMAGLEKTYQDNKAAAKKANNPEGTMLSRGLEKMSIPGVGDLTKYFGNYLGGKAGIDTATEQRASDITHQNTMANVGKDSQKYLDNAMASVEGMKAQAEMKATTNARGSKFSAEQSARGVNQKRSLAWLYDQGLADSLSSISANAANQVSDLFKAKSSTAMSADQLKGEGQFKANMANEAAKDAYYSALSKGRNQFAESIMQTGKDINDAKESKMSWNMMKNSGNLLKGNDDGTLANKDIVYTDKSGKKVTMSRAQLNELLKQAKLT